jgi:Outer membrane protein beta-barrel domain
MKKTALLLFTISSIHIYSQNHFIGVKGGVNATNIISTNFFSQTDSRIGRTAGLTYDFFIKEHFSVGADLIYYQRGFSNDGEFTSDAGNPIGKKYTTTFFYDYLSLPVRSGFTIGNKLHGFANVGVIPSLLLEAKTTTPNVDTDGNTVGNQTYDVTKSVSKFDLAGVMEIGGGYKCTGRFWLYTSFSYQRSFTTITNSEYFANSQIRHTGMTLSLGLKYALKKS